MIGARARDGASGPEPPDARRLRPLLVSSLALVLAAGGYATAVAIAPIPEPTAALLVEAEQRIAADDSAARSAVDAEDLPTAAGWLDGEQVWANTDEAFPIASISKIVTALVCLEASPLEAEDQGETHVWSQEDKRRQDAYIAQNGVAYPIPVGTEVTERQMLTLALLPSANDFAAAYAYSVFGDNDAFISAVDAWKARHGLQSLALFEPTGMDERNAASPADVVRIGRLALDDPTVADLVSTRSAELPWGIGEVRSTNPLFSRLPGMLGIKTGASTSAGYNLLAAQQANASERDLVKIVATLGRPNPEQRMNATRGVLLALDEAPQEVDLVVDAERIGTATTVDGVRIPLVARGSASTVLLPGEQAVRIAKLSAVPVGARGRTAGTIHVETPLGSEDLTVVTAKPVADPDFWWRLTHPAELFARA